MFGKERTNTWRTLLGKMVIILRDDREKAKLSNFCLVSIFFNKRMIFKEASVKT